MITAKNIVIDIETLGRRNDAAITQIGIVIADKNFDILSKHLIQIHFDAWHTCNRTFTGETLLWWMKQNNLPISDKYTDKVHDYKTAMLILDSILEKYNTDDTIIWIKGTMDLFCVKDLYEYFNIEIPWKFWQPRDIRTAKEFIKEWKTVENKNIHNALDDAITELNELKFNLIK